MATAKKPITRSTDPNVRKSPPLSASQFPAGHVAKGNDGNYWTITESGNGIKRWVPVSKTASQSSAITTSKIVSKFKVNDLLVKLDDNNSWKLYYISSIKKSKSVSNDNFIEITECSTDVTGGYLETTLQEYLDNNTYIYRYIPQVGDIIKIDSIGRASAEEKIIEKIDSQTGEVSLSSITARAAIRTYTKEEFTTLLIIKGISIVNFNPNTTVSSPAQSSSSGSSDKNTLEDWQKSIKSKGVLYYDLPKSDVKIYQFLTSNVKSYQFVIELHSSQDVDIVLKYLKEKLDSLASIDISTIVNPIGNILLVTFTFDEDMGTTTKMKELDILDNYLFGTIGIKPSGTSNNPSKFKEYDLLLTANKQDNQKFYDLNFITSVIKSPSGSNDYWIEFKQCVARAYTGGVWENDLVSGSRNIYPYIPQVGDIIALKYSGNPDLTIKIVNIDLPNNEIEIESSASGSTNRYYTKEQFNTLLIERGIEVLNFDPNARGSNIQTSVQQAETKVDDIVFSAPVVPVGTQDQRNATDKLVDEFIAKNENNLKKLAVENVGLLSTIDKTLEFIKAKFGTPAGVTSVSSAVSTVSQPAYPDNIDDYKLMTFVGDDLEIKIIEFNKFKKFKNKSGNVFKYFIGDIFINKDFKDVDGNTTYLKIYGAIDSLKHRGEIMYLRSLPGKLDEGLTWDPEIKYKTVSNFESLIENGSWEFVPGANVNLNKISSAVSNASQTANRQFELGDVVKIKSDSQFFGSNTSNPANVEGVVIDIVKGKSKAFPIRVKWANGKENTYPKDDLFFVSKSVASAPVQAPTTTGGSSVASVGDTVTFYASREKANLTGIVKAIVTGTDGKPYLRINVNGKFYLKQQGSVTKVK